MLCMPNHFKRTENGLITVEEAGKNGHELFNFPMTDSEF